jgi:hypothetical protein
MSQAIYDNNIVWADVYWDTGISVDVTLPAGKDHRIVIAYLMQGVGTTGHYTPTPTYDGHAMEIIFRDNSTYVGNERWSAFYYVVPDTDTGVKTVLMTWSWQKTASLAVFTVSNVRSLRDMEGPTYYGDAYVNSPDHTLDSKPGDLTMNIMGWTNIGDWFTFTETKLTEHTYTGYAGTADIVLLTAVAAGDTYRWYEVQKADYGQAGPCMLVFEGCARYPRVTNVQGMR